MKWKSVVTFWIVCVCVWLASLSQSAMADGEVQSLSLDLPTAIARALQENPELTAKRQALGVAQGRVQQADLLFQENPRVSADVDYRHRRFAQPTGKSAVDTEVRLTQEIEIAGQRGHRREAAAKNLAHAEWSVVDAERLLRREVTQAFYDLLAAQEQIAVRRQVLSTQDAIMQAGLERFAREDISVLEIDTLRLERDRTFTELVSSEEERVRKEAQLRTLLGIGETAPLFARGTLLVLLAEQGRTEKHLVREDLEACALAYRPDVRAARFALEGREAELRLAQARRIPNISAGPLYKLDNEDQVLGAALSIPLPFFNRNQQEISTAMANLQVGRTELEARLLAVKQEVAAAYARVRLAAEQRTPYGITYLDTLARSFSFAQKAYEAGEIPIFEFGVTSDRFVQARLSYLGANVAYLQANAELDAQTAFQCVDTARAKTQEQHTQ